MESNTKGPKLDRYGDPLPEDFPDYPNDLSNKKLQKVYWTAVFMNQTIDDWL